MISNGKICSNIPQLRQVLLVLLLALWPAISLQAQRGGGGDITLWGDFKVDESKIKELKPETFFLTLKDNAGRTVSNQTVTGGGRYRFMGLSIGEYDLVVELDGQEVTRVHVMIPGPEKTDFRHDLELEWNPGTGATNKPGVVSATDYYERSSPNEARFEKANEASAKKDYDQAVMLLRQIVASDPKDFLAWTELASIHFLMNDLSSAEKEYQHALDLRPNFMQALVSLGRLRLAQKNYNDSIQILSTAVSVQPSSPEANYFLGEAYLEMKKGSKAVGYLYEALKLEPIKMAEAHLRLAALYNGAGMKDKAAAEYEQFLKKKPDYPDHKKLEQYIEANKPKTSTKQ